MRKLTPLSLDEFETMPFRLVGHAKLDADPLSVFAEFSDPSLWFPLMKRSVWKTAATSGVGAEREINHTLFGKARERMLAWEPGERVAFTMTEMDSPFVDQMGELYELERDGIYTVWNYVIVARPSRIGRFATPVLRRLLGAHFARSATNIQKRAGSFKGQSQGKQKVS